MACKFIQRPETPEEKYEREHRSKVFNVFEKGNDHGKYDEPMGSMILLHIEETGDGCFKAVLDLTSAEIVPQFFYAVVPVHYGYDIEMGKGKFDVHPQVQEPDAMEKYEFLYKQYEEEVPRIYGGTFYDHVFRLYQDWKGKQKEQSLTSSAL